MNVVSRRRLDAQPSPRTRTTSRSRYRRLGDAYRASGARPAVPRHLRPRPARRSSSERPWAAHPKSTVVGEGDYAEARHRGDERVPRNRPARCRASCPSRSGTWAGFQTAATRARPASTPARRATRACCPRTRPRLDRRTGPARDQASQLSDALRVAYCQAKVGAIFNFHLADEPGLAGWQSGVLWADWTPKPSYGSFRRAVSDVSTRNLNCTPVQEGRPAEAAGRRGDRAAPAHAPSGRHHLCELCATSWQTTRPPTRASATASPPAAPTVWADIRGTGTTRSAALVGPRPSATTYRVWADRDSEDGQRDSDPRRPDDGPPRTANAGVAGERGPCSTASPSSR